MLGGGQGLGGPIESGVPDLFEPVGEDVLDEPLEEGDWSEADGPSIFGPECDRLLGDAEQA